MSKSKQVGALLPLQCCLDVIDQWVERGREHSWNAAAVKAAIADRAANGAIPFRDATSILSAAASPKLIPSSVAGMAWIKDEWQKLKLPNTPGDTRPHS